MAGVTTYLRRAYSVHDWQESELFLASVYIGGDTAPTTTTETYIYSSHHGPYLPSYHHYHWSS